MMNAKFVTEYKKGREKNFFLRNDGNTYFFEKITKACGFTLKVGTESEIQEYINDNNFKFVQLIRVR